MDVPVELVNPDVPGVPVQAVHVLGRQAPELPGPLQGGQGPVGGVGARLREEHVGPVPGKEGLRVQMITRAEDIEAFVHQHHSHILDVLRRHNSSGLPCQREKNMLALCRSLFPDYVLMLQVVGPGDNGQEISMSSGIFTLCNGVCSYFTGGSYQQYMHHCPNELMVWEAIRMMHDRDATDFIFGGVGHYKKKFGSRYAFVPVMVFSRYRFLQDLRITLKSYYQKFTKLLRH